MPVIARRTELITLGDRALAAGSPQVSGLIELRGLKDSKAPQMFKALTVPGFCRNPGNELRGGAVEGAKLPGNNRGSLVKPWVGNPWS
jgi:hypothetical protein